ncbi:MAG: hypothetical protein QOH58_1772 [Thermoleophilaceae bacterium]|nr:hypothetical protein [Thermoleophilaceae bacterium]
MPTIFGPEFEALQLADLQAFLDRADDEPLEWEAKGTEVTSRMVRDAVGGFANSHDGGFLILGVYQQAYGWHLDGFPVPDEPILWISNVIGDGVRPIPVFKVRPLKIEGTDRHVVVVRVDPIATPPCISNGTVFERVPGATKRVLDPQRLAELYARGDRAHAEAQGKARRLRRTMLDLGRLHPMYQSNRVQVALTAATAGYQSDVSGRLFTPRFREKLWELSEHTLLSGAPNNLVERRADISQDTHRLTSAAPSMGMSNGWIAQGTWDGAGGIFWVIEQEVSRNDSLTENVIAPAWRAAIALLEAVGGYGPSYVALCVCGGGHPPNIETFGADPEPGTKLDRGPIDRTVEGLDLESVRRELDRALHIDAFEPEGESEPEEQEQPE